MHILEVDPYDGSIVSTWNYDHVFDANTSTEEVYLQVVRGGRRREIPTVSLD